MIGELSAKGQSPYGQDQDDTMILPYTTVMKKLAGISWLQSITVSATSSADMDAAQAQILRITWAETSAHIFLRLAN